VKIAYQLLSRSLNL